MLAWATWVLCRTLSRAISIFGTTLLAGSHLELSRGKWSENVKYCTKQSSRVAGPWFVGDCTDPADVDLRERREDEPDFSCLPANWRFITVCWGPPAIGKSRVWNIIFEYVGGGIYNVPGKAKNSSGRWLGNYNGEQCAIIDEFDFDSDFDESQWKLVLDRRPQVLPATMGGRSVLWAPQCIVLLSNHPIGPGHPFTGMVFRTRFSESFNDWNWITTVEGERHPRLPCPLYNPPIRLHDTIDMYPRYISPADRKHSKRSAPSAADSAELVTRLYESSGVRYTGPDPKRSRPSAAPAAEPPRRQDSRTSSSSQTHSQSSSSSCSASGSLELTHDFTEIELNTCAICGLDWLACKCDVVE